MNNIKLYKILYYVCFITTTILYFNFISPITYFGVSNILQIALAIINLLLVIVFSIKLFRKKLNKITNIFPIIYLLFLIIVWVLSIFMNDKLVIQYIHYGYYLNIMLFNYILFNLYSILSFK